MRTHSSYINLIIVNWNGRPFLKDCLESLERQTLQDFSIIFVDNNSEDESVEFVSKCFPKVRIVPLNRNFGFAIANNVGFKTGNSQYLVTLNNDTVVHPRWLELLAAAMDRDGGIGFAASKMLFHSDTDVIDRVGDAYTNAGVGRLRGRNHPSHCYSEDAYIFGACAGAAIYRRSMVDHIGYFDEDFFLLYEDVDLSFRAQLWGYKCLFVPDAIVYHRGSESIGKDSVTSIYYSHRNLEWVYLINMPKYLLIKCAPLHFAYILLSLFYFSAIGEAATYLRAKVDAIKGLKRVLKKRLIIQQGRAVSESYIESILEKEKFIDRLIRRF